MWIYRIQPYSRISVVPYAAAHAVGEEVLGKKRVGTTESSTVWDWDGKSLGCIFICTHIGDWRRTQVRAGRGLDLP